MTRRAGAPGILRRHRRGLMILAAAVLLVALGAVLAAPFVLRKIGERLLERGWGGPAEVDWAWWSFGSELRLRGVRVRVPGQERPLAQVGSVNLQFERSFLKGDPGKLVSATFGKGEFAKGERAFAAVEEIKYDARPSKVLLIRGLDGELERERESVWVDTIKRIVDSPGLRGKDEGGGGDPLERIEVEDSRVRFVFPMPNAAPKILPLQALKLRLRIGRPKRVAIEDIRGELFGGQVVGFGDVGWSEKLAGHLQVHLTDMDLAAAAKESGVVSQSTSGSITAFVDLVKPAGPEGDIGGAGWVMGKELRLWQHPILAGLLGTLGLTVGEEDALRRVRALFRVDRGHIYSDNLIAMGRPLSLFGRGSVRLDGEELDARFIPRLFARNIRKIPVMGKPTQVLLDLANGQLVEVKVEGSLANAKISVHPVSSITDPLKAFLGFFSDEDEEK